MRKLIKLFTLVLAILALENCVDPVLVISNNDLDSQVLQRSECAIISQTYVNDIKSLVANDLGASIGSVKVGLVNAVTASGGVWIEPEELVGYIVDNFEEILFVAYIDNPTNDSTITGYYYDTTYCVSPSESKMIIGDLDSTLQSTLGFIAEDIDNF